MEIVMNRTADIKPYPGNPRDNDNAVPYIAESIKQFGFRVPIVLDPDGVIVCGHTRWKAAQKLGIEEVPSGHHSVYLRPQPGCRRALQLHLRQKAALVR